MAKKAMIIITVVTVLMSAFTYNIYASERYLTYDEVIEQYNEYFSTHKSSGRITYISEEEYGNSTPKVTKSQLEKQLQSYDKYSVYHVTVSSWVVGDKENTYTVQDFYFE